MCDTPEWDNSQFSDYDCHVPKIFLHFEDSSPPSLKII